jgi:hypothetical protein
MPNQPRSVPNAPSLSKAEATRLRELLELQDTGSLPDGGQIELRALLARWTAAHAAWSDRMFNPPPAKGHPDRY